MGKKWDELKSNMALDKEVIGRAKWKIALENQRKCIQNFLFYSRSFSLLFFSLSPAVCVCVSVCLCVCVCVCVCVYVLLPFHPFILQVLMKINFRRSYWLFLSVNSTFFLFYYIISLYKLASREVIVYLSLSTAQWPTTLYPLFSHLLYHYSMQISFKRSDYLFLSIPVNSKMT